MECEKCTKIMEYVCDELCKWPYQLGEEELEKKCKECKVDKIFEEGGCALDIKDKEKKKG